MPSIRQIEKVFNALKLPGSIPRVLDSIESSFSGEMIRYNGKVCRVIISKQDTLKTRDGKVHGIFFPGKTCRIVIFNNKNKPRMYTCLIHEYLHFIEYVDREKMNHTVLHLCACIYAYMKTKPKTVKD